MKQEWESAVQLGDVEAVRSMIERGADVDSRDRHGQTAIMLAARNGHAEICRLLVSAGVDLNVTAKFGLSALMLAVVNHHEDIAKLLAQSGADLSLKGSGAPGFSGKNAADLARAGGLLELVAELER